MKTGQAERARTKLRSPDTQYLRSLRIVADADLRETMTRISTHNRPKRTLLDSRRSERQDGETERDAD